MRDRREVWHEVGTEFVEGKIGELSDTVFGGVRVAGRERELGEFGGCDHVGLEVDETREDFGVGRITFVVLDGEIGEVGDVGRVGEERGIGLGDEIKELFGSYSGGGNEKKGKQYGEE